MKKYGKQVQLKALEQRETGDLALNGRQFNHSNKKK
jgi:hypothetical protein